MQCCFMYHANHDDHFSARVEAVTAPASGCPYYRMILGLDVTIFLSDADCRAIWEAINSRPPLPKSDAQIDAEAEEARGGFPPDFERRQDEEESYLITYTLDEEESHISEVPYAR